VRVELADRTLQLTVDPIASLEQLLDVLTQRTRRHPRHIDGSQTIKR
jgi:hypothetical protein